MVYSGWPKDISRQQVIRCTSWGTAPPDTSIAKDLSEREREVLGLLARGMTNAEIAKRLYLSEGTVRNYVSAILEKLDVADRTQAAVLALRHGLANPNGV